MYLRDVLSLRGEGAPGEKGWMAGYRGAEQRKMGIRHLAPHSHVSFKGHHNKMTSDFSTRMNLFMNLIIS